MNCFGGPQPVAVSDEDHRGIAVAVTVALRGFDQRLDLALGQVLARAQF